MRSITSPVRWLRSDSRSPTTWPSSFFRASRRRVVYWSGVAQPEAVRKKAATATAANSILDVMLRSFYANRLPAGRTYFTLLAAVREEPGAKPGSQRDQYCDR